MTLNIFIIAQRSAHNKLIPIIASSPFPGIAASHESRSSSQVRGINAHEYEIDAEANDCNFCFRKTSEKRSDLLGPALVWVELVWFIDILGLAFHVNNITNFRQLQLSEKLPLILIIDQYIMLYVRALSLNAGAMVSAWVGCELSKGNNCVIIPRLDENIK